jgi:TfoX/Sxy family transcriptional regulator of competence genes
MASDQEFMDYVSEQLRGVPRASYRKMFGEYAVYVGTKVVALVCDNQLFVKPTGAGLAVLGAPTYGPPYPGAKPFFLMQGELEDADFMARLIAATEAEVPVPKPKKEKVQSPKAKTKPKKPAAKK